MSESKRETATPMDAESRMAEKEFRRARKLYVRHRIFVIAMAGVIGGAGAYLFYPVGGGGNFWVYLVFSFVALFLLDWVAAVLFKRKGRPWQWGSHPEDENPGKRFR